MSTSKNIKNETSFHKNRILETGKDKIDEESYQNILSSKDKEGKDSSFKQNRNDDSPKKAPDKLEEENKSKLYEPTDREVYAYDICLFLDKNSNEYILKDDIPTIAYNNVVVFSPEMFSTKTKRFYENKDMIHKVDKEIIELTDFMKQIDKLESLSLETLIKIRFDIYKKRFNCCFMKDKLINVLLAMRFKNAKIILVKVMNKKLGSKGRDYIGAVVTLILTGLKVSNHISDIILLIAIFQLNMKSLNIQFTILFIVRFFAVLSNYLISYSSGIQLLISKACYEPSQYKRYSKIKKFFLTLNFTLMGPLFFIFLTVFDIWSNVVLSLITLLVFKNEHFYFLAAKVRGLIHNLGLYENEYDGILQQGDIATLLFQNSFILIFDTLILTGNLQAPGLLEQNLKALIISYITTIINIIKMLYILSTQSKFFREDLLTYSFVTMKAKFNWIPFINNIRNGSVADKIIDYYLIRCPLPIVTQMTGNTQNFSFEFNELAINRIREEIACLNINRLPDDPLLKIRMGRCIDQVSIPIMGHFISVLLNDAIDIDFFGADWDACIDLSFQKKIIKYNKRSEEKWKALTPVGESIISLVIRTEKDDHFELEPLLKALINRNVDLNLVDTRNFTPLTLATKYKKLRSIEHLLKGGARPNEPDPRANEYPLEIALENAITDESDEPPEKDLKIINLLLSNGADPFTYLDYNGFKKSIFHKAIEAIIGTEDKKFRAKFSLLELFVDYGCKVQTKEESLSLLEAIAYTRAYNGKEYYDILDRAIPSNINFHELVDDSGNTFLHLFLRYLNEASKFEDLQSFYPNDKFNYKELLGKLNNHNETPVSHCLNFAVDIMILFEFDKNIESNSKQIVTYFRNYDDVFARNLTSYISNFLLLEDTSPLNYLEDLFFNENENDHETNRRDLVEKIKKRLTKVSLKQNKDNMAINLDESLDKNINNKKRSKDQIEKFEYLIRKAFETDATLKENDLVLKRLAIRYNIIVNKDENSQPIKTEDTHKIRKTIKQVESIKSSHLEITLNDVKKIPNSISSLFASKIDYLSLQKIEKSPIKAKKKFELKMMTFNMDHLTNLILQMISFVDFITDIFIIKDLFYFGNRAWTSIAVLSVLIAYLTSYAPLISFFVARKSFNFEKKIKNVSRIPSKRLSGIIKTKPRNKPKNDEHNQNIPKIQDNNNNNEQVSLRSINILSNSMLIDPNLIIFKKEVPAFPSSNPSYDYNTKIYIDEAIQPGKGASGLEKVMSGLVKSIYGSVFLSPLCLVYFFLLDIFYLVIELTIFSLRLTISLLGFGAYADIIDPNLIPKIYNKIFKLNHMDVKGFRKLRTISQLIFETIPMIILQIVILSVKSPNEDQFEISYDLLVVSIFFALLHFLFEVTLLYSEAKALLTNLNYYIIICLNGRLNWVPHSESIVADVLNNHDDHINNSKIPKIQSIILSNGKTNDEECNPTYAELSNPSSPISLLNKKFELLKQNSAQKPKIYYYSEMAYTCLRKINIDYKFYHSTIDILGNCFTNMPLAKSKSELPIINVGNTCAKVQLAIILPILKLGYGKVKIQANWHQIIENSFRLPPKSQPHDADGEYILISLTQTECIDGLRPFLEKVKHLDCNVKSIKTGKSLPLVAIENNAYDILDLLLAHNVSISQAAIKNKNILMNALENPDPSNFNLLVNLLTHPKVALSSRRKLQALDTIKLLFSQNRKAEAFVLIDLLGGLNIQINGESLINLLNINVEGLSLPEKVSICFEESNTNQYQSPSKKNKLNRKNTKTTQSKPVYLVDNFDLEILKNFRGLRYGLPGLLSSCYSKEQFSAFQDKLLLNNNKFRQLYDITKKQQLPMSFYEDDFDLEYLDNMVEHIGLDNKPFADYYYLTGMFRKELEIKVNLSNNNVKQFFGNELLDVPYCQYDDLFEKLCQITMPNEALALKSIDFLCELKLDQSDYHSFDLFVETQYDCFFETIYTFTSKDNKINMKYDGINYPLNVFQIPISGAKFSLFLTHTDNKKLIQFNGSITFTLYVRSDFNLDTEHDSNLY